MTCSLAFHGMNVFSLMSFIAARKRPTFDVFVPDAYKMLINRCWSQDPSERPNFYEIVNELRQDQSYITESVNIEEFKNYVNYIEGYETSFNVENVIIPVNIINFEQIQLNDKLIKIFDNQKKK